MHDLNLRADGRLRSAEVERHDHLRPARLCTIESFLVVRRRRTSRPTPRRSRRRSSRRPTLSAPLLAIPRSTPKIGIRASLDVDRCSARACTQTKNLEDGGTIRSRAAISPRRRSSRTAGSPDMDLQADVRPQLRRHQLRRAGRDLDARAHRHRRHAHRRDPHGRVRHHARVLEALNCQGARRPVLLASVGSNDGRCSPWRSSKRATASEALPAGAATGTRWVTARSRVRQTSPFRWRPCWRRFAGDEFSDVPFYRQATTRSVSTCA